MIKRRSVVAGAGAAAVGLAAPASAAGLAGRFPEGFLWGAATAAHQVEGNNTASDMWLLESVKPTMFAEPSGDADNSLELWSTDLDLVRQLGLNAYRFSLEWARIEPEPGLFSIAMLDHYKAVIAGCRARGLTPVVTFNHFTVPLWFAKQGSWTSPESPKLFARYCDRAARHLAAEIGYATTLNEPNAGNLVVEAFPSAQLSAGLRAMNAAAQRATDSPAFRMAMLPEEKDAKIAQANMIAAHKAGRAAMKAARGDMPVGVSLSMQDDQAVGRKSLRDAKRQAIYGDWLQAAKGDDFLGVQNYTRVRWSDKGSIPPPVGATQASNGMEVFPPSLANTVRYAHEATGLPIIVTEHGVGTDDDMIRAQLIPAALAELQKIIAAGVPVKGYLHWSLIDNFEWMSGYAQKYGLCSVDRTTFKRTPKPSAAVYAAVAQHNSI